MTKRKTKPSTQRKRKGRVARDLAALIVDGDEIDVVTAPRSPTDLLGRVVGDTRDNVIEILESEATKRQRAATSRAVHRALFTWPAAAKRDLADVVAHVVDLTLHSLLVNLEAEYDLRLMARDGKKWVDLRDASVKGLYVELYGPDGWLRRFSQHPLSRFERGVDDH